MKANRPPSKHSGRPSQGKTKHHARHKHNPAGSKMGFDGGELTRANNERAETRELRSVVWG